MMLKRRWETFSISLVEYRLLCAFSTATEPMTVHEAAKWCEPRLHFPQAYGPVDRLMQLKMLHESPRKSIDVIRSYRITDLGRTVRMEFADLVASENERSERRA